MGNIIIFYQNRRGDGLSAAKDKPKRPLGIARFRRFQGLELATGPKRTGFYYDQNLREVKANKNAYDKDAQKQLWNLSEKLVSPYLD